MTTLTKEQLISHARESVSYLEDLKGRVSKEGADCKVVIEMVARDLKLARIALASLEAKPIGAFHIAEQQVDGTSDYLKDGEWPIDNGIIEVYSAPPVPVVPAALPENDDEDGHDIDCLEPSEVYALGRTAGWNACRAAMLQGADGNSPAIPDAYDIEAFGVFSATEGENGLMLQIERFRFGTGKCPQIGKENMVPKFALQAIINRLQEHCDSMGNEALVDILSTPAAPQQEVK
ncbi:TPA: hypothetical protein ACGRU4_001694 [Escherichia coli]